VAYVERTISMGFLYLNSHLKKTRPEPIKSKPNQRTESGREKEKGIPKKIVNKYPITRNTDNVVNTTSETMKTTLSRVDLFTILSPLNTF
jgi:hypothetical protein